MRAALDWFILPDSLGFARAVPEGFELRNALGNAVIEAALLADMLDLPLRVELAEYLDNLGTARAIFTPSDDAFDIDTQQQPTELHLAARPREEKALELDIGMAQWESALPIVEIGDPEWMFLGPEWHDEPIEEPRKATRAGVPITLKDKKKR